MRSATTTDRRRMIWAALVLAIVLFVALNIFSNVTFTAARLDLTEDAMFTVTDGTREVLASIDEPVVLRLFVSDVLEERAPGLGNYADRVRELLAHYENLGRGKIRLELYRPERHLSVTHVGADTQLNEDGGPALAVVGVKGTCVYVFWSAERLTTKRANLRRQQVVDLVSGWHWSACDLVGKVLFLHGRRLHLRRCFFRRRRFRTASKGACAEKP